MTLEQLVVISKLLPVTIFITNRTLGLDLLVTIQTQGHLPHPCLGFYVSNGYQLEKTKTEMGTLMDTMLGQILHQLILYYYNVTHI